MIRAALALALLGTPLAAEMPRNCAPRDIVVERLASGYGEAPRSMGIGANNTVVEVFASEETGTRTITVTTPNGITCLVASGIAFEELVAVATRPGEAL